MKCMITADPLFHYATRLIFFHVRKCLPTYIIIALPDKYLCITSLAFIIGNTWKQNAFSVPADQ